MYQLDAILCRVKLKDRTVGKLFDLKGKCYITLELPWLDNKQNISCITDGIYPFVKEYSPHSKEMRIELKLVPNRSEIQIHSAGKLSDLKGCIGHASEANEKAFFESMPDRGWIQVETIEI